MELEDDLGKQSGFLGQNSESSLDTRDLLYPFAIVLLMLSFFDLTGTVTSLGFLVMLILDILQLDTSLSSLITLAINVSAQIGAILIFIFLHRANKVEPEEKVMPPSNPWQVLYLVFSVDLAFLISVVYFVDQLLAPLGENVSTYESIFPTSDLLANPIYYVLFFGVLVFGAAIAEELIFRRTLIPLLERRGLGMFWTLVISSLMFSLIHTPADLLLGSPRFTVVHFLGTFIGGLTLGYLYLRTRKIIYPMVMHGLSNGVSALGLIALEAQNLELVTTLSFFLLITVFIGVGVILWLVVDFFRTKAEPSTWKRILTDFKFKDRRLQPILIMMGFFILIEGGRDLVFRILFEFLGPVSRERYVLESTIEIGYFLVLITVLIFFIFRMTQPIQNPDWILFPVISPVVSHAFSHPLPSSFQVEPEHTALCPSCQQRNISGATFCVFCGTKLGEKQETTTLCPSCHQRILPGAVFCVFCGTNLRGDSK